MAAIARQPVGLKPQWLQDGDAGDIGCHGDGDDGDAGDIGCHSTTQAQIHTYINWFCVKTGGL